MTSTSRPTPTYARFIPREELGGFAAWTPDSIGEPPVQGAGEPSAASAEGQLAARQAGYQDGYRDGLAALEGFKQSYARQITAQVGHLLAAFEAQFAALEAQIAQAVANTSVQLARQVVRDEITARPALVAQVASEAVNAVLMSARHIRVQVHPDDHALIAAGAAEALSARGARLMNNPAISRGGCLIESDVGTIDARIEARWAQAAALLGAAQPLDGPTDAA